MSGLRQALLGQVSGLFSKIDELSAVQAQTAGLSTRIIRDLQSGRLESKFSAFVKPPVVCAGDNVVACEVDGFILGVPGEEWRMAAYFAFRGVMEPGVVALFKKLVKPGMVVVDVGANVGIYTLEAARLTGVEGKVYSFEPSPRIYAILKDNIQVNGFLEHGLTCARDVAVSDRAGISNFYVHPDNSGHSTLFRDEGAHEQIDVQTISLTKLSRRVRKWMS